MSATRRRIAGAGTSLVPFVVALVVSPVGAQDTDVSAYRAGDRSVVALNILPPGQGRYLNGPELVRSQTTGEQPAHNADQLAVYDSLVQGAPDVTMGDLQKYFKDASFGVKPDDVERQYEPRPGVTVVRDAAFGVPHVYGETRSDVMFGAGYVSGEDRLFMMDTLRHVGRGRLSEFLGPSPANLAMDRAAYLTAGYSEEELQEMIDHLDELHPKLGPTVQQDVADYAEGINAYIAEAMADPSKLPGEYEALQQVPEEWKPTDTVAVASLIGARLGVGGGRELLNAAFIQALQKDAGMTYAQAHRVFDDFKLAEDPETPVHTNKTFSWNEDLGPIDKRAVVMPDDAAAVAQQASAAILPEYADGPFGPIDLRFPTSMSNALLVAPRLSKSGRSLAVYGPQTGYFSPQILMELDLHGPGIHARGVGFPGISLYVLLGRGTDYGWSATSASGDQVDVFAEKLCNPEGGEVQEDSTFYMKDGDCTEMYSRTDRWFAKPSAGGAPEEPGAVMVEMTTQRTDNGIVQARGTVGGEPVAFVAQRASFGAEVDGAATYVDMMDPTKINGPADFRGAFGRFSFTFNWLYLDPDDITFQLVGYHPLRARGIDPDLPNWGTSRWDWTGRLSLGNTPWETNPRKGFLTSWNNKHAPGFRANDARYTYGRVHRVMLLNDGLRRAIKRRGNLDLADLVNIMGDAATIDLRGYAVLPYMLRVIGTPDEPKLKEAVSALRAWRNDGAHRRDKDLDGAYEHAPAIALMDAWWEPALQAIFEPVMGAGGFAAFPGEHDNAPGPVGSAYNDGLYSHVEKDLRTILGLGVRGRFSRIYCGKGSLPACRDVLTQSLAAAVATLTEAYGADLAQWEADEEGDKIQFSELGVVSQDPMQWQNRPTFQQVLEFR